MQCVLIMSPSVWLQGMTRKFKIILNITLLMLYEK